MALPHGVGCPCSGDKLAAFWCIWRAAASELEDCFEVICSTCFRKVFVVWEIPTCLLFNSLRASIKYCATCHQKAVLAKALRRKPAGCSKVTGTKSLDALWRSLQRFLPVTISRKRCHKLLESYLHLPVVLKLKHA